MESPAPLRPPIERLVERVLSLHHLGHTVEAEALLIDRVAQARERFGPGTATYAESHAASASYLNHFAGRYGEALAHYREAIAWVPPTQDVTPYRNYLTYLLEYGQLLDSVGEQAEAETILRRGVEGRELTYGKDAAGYAFGLEPLALALLNRGDLESALHLLEACLAIFRRLQHPRLIQSLLLRAAALRMANYDGPVLMISGMSVDAATDLAKQAPDLLQGFVPAIQNPILFELAERIGPILGADHPLRRQLLTQIVNNGTLPEFDGDHARRIDCAREVFASYNRQRQYDEAGRALLALALAQSDAGDLVGAAKSYRQARIGGEKLGNWWQVCKAERNYALMLTTQERTSAQAETHLRNAITAAQSVGDPVLIGESEGCLGIYLQHCGRGAEAAPLLTSALAKVPPDHHEAVTIRAHYDALGTAGTCGCDNLAEATLTQEKATIRAHIEREMPGIVANVVITDTDVTVEMNREMTNAEAERFPILLQQARALFAKNSRQRQ